jgi:fructokinase
VSRTLCLGEALVDLICERPVADFSEADAFVPHFGGATANVAVSAARRGAGVGLSGAVGADRWGAWLRDRLDAEGVDLTWFQAVDDLATPLACIALSADGEPTFTIYDAGFGAAMHALADDVEKAVADFDALFFGSNTLAGAVEREVTERARREALRLGRPVLLDANLRLERWASVECAAEAVRACVPGALLVRTNRHEAEVLTGRSDPREATRALLAMGAQAVVVTLGADGALLGGEYWRLEAGIPAAVRSTVGAGDALTGVLVAALTRSAYDPSSLVEALPAAVAEGARATQRWGAVDPRPPSR